MQRITSYTADDLPIKLDVVFQRGAPFGSLIGATIEAFAKGKGTIAANSATVLTASSVQIVFNENTLSAGQWELQVRATVGSITQTIGDATIIVKESI